MVLATYCADYLAGFVNHGNRLSYIPHDDLRRIWAAEGSVDLADIQVARAVTRRQSFKTLGVDGSFR